ncbi:hypothetical protein K2Z84_18710 [Candidatus Binatia bacterium]|nr:hypothetical protein [Candidatus Binatia bacterium]
MNAPGRRGIELLLTLLLVSAAPGAARAQPRDAAVTPDGSRVLINRDVADERWAITVNRDATVTGNVTRADGAVTFLWCRESSRSSTVVRLGCFAAPSDGDGCSDASWAPLGDVEVPISFLSPTSATAAAVARSRVATTRGGQARSMRRLSPDGQRVLIGKDVGDERWAITLNEADRSVNGNVFSARGASFLACTRVGDDGSDAAAASAVRYACAIAAPCVDSPCSDTRWQDAGELTLPASFFGGDECRGPQRASAEALVDFLASQLDRYHERFIVYEDVSSAGNHFPAFGKIPSGDAAIEVNGSWPIDPHAGATSMRFVFRDRDFAGFYMLNGVLRGEAVAPTPNFGTEPDAGIDLRGAVKLTFWARGERGGEKVDFFVGGVGRGTPGAPFPESFARRPARAAPTELSPEWRPYEIDLRGVDLSYVLGGFAWVASRADNPAGAVFFVDDVAFELAPEARVRRLAAPRFVASFVTDPVQPDPNDADKDDDVDLVLRNLAFSYDNALVLLAFLAEGSSRSLARARLIGDAFLYAQDHDRTFHDGRIRTAYQAGDLALPPGWTPRGEAGTVPVSGFYDEAEQQFVEVEQSSVDVGNNAWVMIALLALHDRTGDARYLAGSRRIGEFIRTFRNDAGRYRGFLGRILDPETNPRRQEFASVEHNLDVAAAFREMAAATGEVQWLDDAQHAQELVEALWDPGPRCYRPGTLDPETANTKPDQLAMDVHPWSVLAIPELVAVHPDTLSCPERFHRAQSDGFSGFDFNPDRDGVWFEGTAHMATAYAHRGRFADAERLRAELRRAQATPPFGRDGGIAAAAHDGVSSGFDFKLLRRLHVGATAWSAFAQLGFDPYHQRWSGE